MILPKIVAANWKMHTDLPQGRVLAKEISEKLESLKEIEGRKIILAVPFTHLSSLYQILDYKRIMLAAQNCASEEHGAFTGEISVSMIKSAGAQYCIIGHSERRQLFKENAELLKKKVTLCLNHALRPIFCCGETLEEREEGRHKDIIKEQLTASLFHISAENIQRCMIAYEPVWAIGTGRTASPDQAQEMHQFIRELLAENYPGLEVRKLPVLYGGSVNPANARELFACRDINGGLIGGASLKADSFIDIIKSFE